MKRLVQMTTLACAILLLAGCPDAKLPSPAPKVPEPKAQSADASSLAHTRPARQQPRLKTAA